MTQLPTWEKRGLLFVPTGGLHPLAESHAAVPFAWPLGGDRFRVYFSARDSSQRSRPFSVDWSPGAGELARLEGPAMDLGELGTFDDSGAMPSWIVRGDDGNLLLYYTGWSLGRTIPFYFYIGLARSSDEGRHFTRVSRAPVLGRNVHDPYLTGAPCVLREGSRWRMWYVSGDRWEPAADGPRHYYNIRYAESRDGVQWEPASRPAVDFEGEEYAFGRPAVVKVEDGYLMWYAVRGDAYSLGIACSRDGETWTRVDRAAGLRASESGWDSEMICYAQVFPSSGGWVMLYNGNGYGRSGMGWASAPRLPTVTQLLGAR